jgi:DNA-binding response OmpR family regulator
MPTIALVDDDHNILASVSIALEAEGYASLRTLMAPLHSTALRPPSLTLPSLISKCPGWTEWRRCAGCD